MVIRSLQLRIDAPSPRRPVRSACDYSVLYHRILSRISSAVPEGPQSWPQIYTGVALTTMATLILELSLTRIFSVVFYYHFAFLAISIALFGLGAGGVFSYVVAPVGSSVFRRLGFIAVLVSAVTVI